MFFCIKIVPFCLYFCSEWFSNGILELLRSRRWLFLKLKYDAMSKKILLFFLILLIAFSCGNEFIIHEQLPGLWVLSEIHAKEIEEKGLSEALFPSIEKYIGDLTLRIEEDGHYTFGITSIQTDILTNRKTVKIKKVRLEEHGRIADDTFITISWRPRYLSENGITTKNHISFSSGQSPYSLSYEFGALPRRKTHSSKFMVTADQLILSGDVILTFVFNETRFAKNDRKVPTALVFRRNTHN